MHRSISLGSPDSRRFPHARPRECDRGLMSLLFLLLLAGCGSQDSEPVANDEAMQRAVFEGKTAKDAARDYFYPRRIEDYFPGMDVVSQAETAGTEHPDQLLDLVGDRRPATKVAPLDLTKEEILGRNTWMIWCGGNEGFWDWLASDNLGFIDLLKLVDSRRRSERFRDGGLINEPGMDQASGPAEFGLWLDQPQDAGIRKWREAYVDQTFAKINAGMHKSQRGLVKETPFGKKPLYVGSYSDAESEPGYDAPSDYITGRRSSSDGDSYGLSADAYDAAIPPPDIYGLSSGVVGLRLFPNPNFDEEARQNWKPERYYGDESYFSDPELVRPYRVGMACAFCHASFHPLRPPRDVTQPEWNNISGNIGAQYLRVRLAFGNLLRKQDFVYHLLDSQPPGTIDTSLIASDNINNPNTMNAVFKLPERALLSFHNPPEDLSAASSALPSIWRHPEAAPPSDAADPAPEKWREVFAAHGLTEKLQASNGNPRFTPRILLDGSDSIGAWGALARVYLNIGSYYERWNQLHQPVLGFTPQQPFRIADCETHSVYWNATELRVAALRDYFLRITPPMPLLSTAGGIDRLVAPNLSQLEKRVAEENRSLAKLQEQERARHVDISKLAQGRKVFARNCIVCHSSLQPESSVFSLFDRVGTETLEQTAAREQEREQYPDEYKGLIDRRQRLRTSWARAGEYWDHDPGQWLRDPDYLRWAEQMVEKPSFWKWNYLSTDYRIPINLVRTNAGRAMATNAMTGHMWEDFSSRSYRQLPSPGPIPYSNPYGENPEMTSQFTPRHRTPPGAPEGGGGPGYYRVPSLVSIWATAPLLHNNSLGVFNNDPSVEGRLKAFDDAIHKLLWPERRFESSSYNNATPERLREDHGLIWRTTEETHLFIKAKIVPSLAQRLPWVARLQQRFPWLAEVRPLWLPSLILLIAAFLVLMVSHHESRNQLGIAVLLFAGVFGLTWYLANRYPSLSYLGWLRSIRPAWLPLLALVFAGVVLLLPLSGKWTRFAGYLSVVLAVGLGTIVYFNAGGLGDLRIGPIPKGTPVNLIANFNSEADPRKLKRTINTVVAGLAEIRSRNLDQRDTDQVLRKKIAPALMEVNKCPDFVMDQGHYYEWFKTMTDDDKEALIELLKTF